MSRPMRKKDYEVGTDRAFEILENSEYGFLSTISEDGSPYCVALSHILLDKSIYFHCAVQGHKIDNIRRDNRVCFTAVSKVMVLPSEFTTEYESAIVFGRVEILEDKGEKLSAMLKICEKYSSEFMNGAEGTIQRVMDKFLIGRIAIEHISGKVKSGK